MERLRCGQGSISFEYQTYTSPYPFDTLETGMAQAVGAKFTLKEVATFRTLAPGHISMETFELIAAQVDQKKEEVDKVEQRTVEVWDSCAVVQMFLSPS